MPPDPPTDRLVGRTLAIQTLHVGDRSRKSAKRLWAKMPQAYRQHATFYTDQYVVYEGMIPAARHPAVSKLARIANHLERFNNTLRPRVSAWSVRCCRVPRNSAIISVPSNCSSVTAPSREVQRRMSIIWILLPSLGP
jgi:IS1 family transposase